MLNNSNLIRHILSLIVIGFGLLFSSASASAQTTAFTYQGKLADNGNPTPTGNYDFQFTLFDALSGGAQQGTTQTATNVLVTNGTFSVTLDFVNCSGCSCPTCFNGGPRFLAIAVRPTGGGSFTALTPRQPITSTPYALKSASSGAADGLSVACVSCVTSSQIASVSGSAVTGTIPVAGVPADSPNYIQNRTSPPQSSSNFNISGNGTADIFNAATQFNIGGNRILSSGGNSNLFAGQGAGNLNTGINNAFFGRDAGRFNISGSSNSFFGSGAGFNNDDGGNNTFIGTSAGFNSFGSLASGNTFVGVSSGGGNTTGRGNTMIGFSADVPVAGGVINASAIGSRAFVTQSNSLVLGSINGVNSALADTNVGIGTTAPSQRLHVVGNGLFTGNLTVNGTLNANLPTANSTVGGTLNGTIVNATVQFNIHGERILSNSGIQSLFVGIGAGAANTEFAIGNSFFGQLAGTSNAFGQNNSFFGVNAGVNHTEGNNNSIFGLNAGVADQSGANNSLFGVGADFSGSNFSGNDNTLLGYNAKATENLGNQTAIGAFASVTQSNSLVLGSINGVNGATVDTRVGIGTTAPGYKLEIVDAGNAGLRVQTNTTGGKLASFAANGDFQIDRPGIEGGRFIVQEGGNVGIGVQIPQDKLDVNGFVRLRQLASGNFTTLCINNSSQISNCSSSIRYKTNIAKLSSSLTIINQLHPVTFNWKANNERDMGLIAEEVAKVEPLLTFHNDIGEIEGVKYDRITVVLLNAVKEQQLTIESLQKENLEMKARMAALERLMQHNSILRTTP